MTHEILFEAEKISKKFGAHYALRDISFEIRSGEVLGLIGENGAGKSTLFKIINGVQPQTSGEMKMRGTAFTPKNADDAHCAGIGMVFQEQSLITNLTVGQNIFFGQEKRFRKNGFINWKHMYQEAEKALEIVDLSHINPKTKVGDLQFSTRQMVEIAKVFNLAMGENCGRSKDEKAIILLDEPTSILNDEEVGKLFDLIEHIKAEGHGVVFVSHRLDEVLRITDRIVVFRDGENTGEVQTKDADENKLYEMMVGRATSGEYYRIARQTSPGENVVMSVKDLSMYGEFKDVSFDLHKGEVLGICGVEGSGKESLCSVIVGDDKPTEGTITVGGKPCRFTAPNQALKNGILGIPKERRDEGIIGILSISENVCVSNYDVVKQKGILSKKLQDKAVDDLIKRLNIKCGDREELVESLSGGNAQKVLFARLILSGSHILVLNHPTRGVDIGAKEEIYSLIRDVTERGISVVLLGDTLDECIGLSNRVIIMKDGFVTGEVGAGKDNKPDQVEIVKYMM